MQLIRSVLLLFCILIEKVRTEELIKYGDFQDYVLDQIYSDTYPYQYTKIYPNSTPSWYIQQYKYNGYYQVRNLQIDGVQTQGLDPACAKNHTTCQDVQTDPRKTYSLSFNYLMDRNVYSSILTVQWNNIVILNQIVASQIPLSFIYSISEVMNYSGTICFTSSELEGLFIDNISIVSRTVEETIQFSIHIIEEPTNTILLISNYSVDPNQLSVFMNSSLFFNDTAETIDNISTGLNSTLEFLVTLSYPIFEFDSVSILLPNQTYINQNAQQVSFQVIDPQIPVTQQNSTGNQTVNSSQNQNDNSTSQNQSDIQEGKESNNSNEDGNQFQSLRETFFYLFISMQSLMIIGFTALIFKFLSFTNIMILYIFLNVPYLQMTARASLEAFAKLLFDESIISIINNMVQGTDIDFFDRKFDTDFAYKEKSIYPSDWQGSSLAIVSIEYNYTYSLVQDFILIIINLLKILMIYIFLMKKRNANNDMQNVYRSYKNDIKKNILIEFISLAPVYTAIVGYNLGPNRLKGHSNFYQKMYELHFPLVLFLFIVFGVLYQINRSPSKKSRLSKLEKILRKLDICQNYYYIFIGFLAGLGHTWVFLTVTSIYYIIYMIFLAKKWEAKKDFVFILIRKMAELIVHCGFCFLFVTGNLITDRSIVEQNCRFASEIIIFGYLFGCIFQLLSTLINFIISLKNGLVMVVKNCCLKKKNSIKPKPEIQPHSSVQAEAKPRTDYDQMMDENFQTRNISQPQKEKVAKKNKTHDNKLKINYKDENQEQQIRKEYPGREIEKIGIQYINGTQTTQMYGYIIHSPKKEEKMPQPKKQKQPKKERKNDALQIEATQQKRGKK